MKKRINKKTLILLSLLLLLPLFSGCFLFPSTNHAPTITSTSITTATVDVLYVYNVEATDSDSGDILTYSLTTNPSGMTINSGTGEISWTPISSQIGDHNVTVGVSDGDEHDTQSFVIVVSEAPPAPPPPTPTNHAPTITSTPDTLATVGVLYTYDVNATDSDGDTLTYSLTTNPTGMTIDSGTGEISWTPIPSQIGDHDVTVDVSDGEKSTTQSFTITVHDVLDHIVVLPETMTLFVGEDGTLASITASYNYGSDKVIPLDDSGCSYSWTIGGKASVTNGVVTGVAAGSDTLTVSYEENSVTKTDTVEVTVNPILLTSITVLPETMTLFVGEDGTLVSITASYNYGSDKVIPLDDSGCSYSWTIGGKASVTNGVVTGVAAGSDTLTVSYEENSVTKTDTVEVTVNPILLTSITVLPETMTLFVGEDGTLVSITASYNYGSDKVIPLDDSGCSYSWTIGGKASVTNGVVTGVAAGSDTLTVSYEENSVTKTDTVEVTVNPILLTSITVLPETMTLFVGEDGTLVSITASYNYGSDKVIPLDDSGCSYSWTIGGKASVTNGVVTGVAAGSDTLTVSYEENSVTKTDTVEVAVNAKLTEIVVLPETMDLFITVIGAGETETIASITAHYNNGDTAPIALDNPNCTYGSNNESVATVAVGVVTAVGAGTAIITVTYTEGGILKEDTVEVTVDSANLELTPSTQSVDVGNPVTINILVEDVTELLGGNITLNFDAIKLQCILCIPGSFFAPGFAFVIPTIDNVSGSVILALTTLGEQPSGTGNIVTITFNTVATGVADITFGTTILRDKNNDDIVHTKGSGCSVTIN